MRNLNLAPPAVVEAYTQARTVLASRLLEGAA
jgi:hypothetical protein